MRIVLRNQGRGRKDAVYVLDAVGFGNAAEAIYWVYAYWGKWEKFRSDDLDGLREQQKYQGDCRGSLMTCVRKLVAEKMGKGYQVQEEFSRLPAWPILPHGQDWHDV